MKVMTVRGTIDVQDIGKTLSHEHIFIDIRNQFPSASGLPGANADKKVSADDKKSLDENPYLIKDNLLIDDFETAGHELAFFKNAGGSTIVECTCRGIGRKPEALRKISDSTGINIIAGCGYYTYDTHPAGLATWAPEKIRDDILQDLTSGIDKTNIRSGIIGEIGTSDPVHPDEWKVLEAAAMASRDTDAAIQIHTNPWSKHGTAIVEFMLKQKVNPAKIIICHTDVLLDSCYIHDILKYRVFIQFDNFGHIFGGVNNDNKRIMLLKELFEKGFGRQLLITSDICLKSQLRTYGGTGYSHILENIIPSMLRSGFSEDDIRLLIVENPGRILKMKDFS